MIGVLKQFSAHTQNAVAKVLDLGQKVPLDSSNILLVRRPNELLAKRQGDIVDKHFSCDGKTLGLCNASHNCHVSVAAPDSIEAMLDFARESPGPVAPGSDLIANAFPLMMAHAWSALVVGRATSAGPRPATPSSAVRMSISGSGSRKPATPRNRGRDAARRTHVDAGRQCQLALLRRQFLSCGVSGRQAG